MWCKTSSKNPKVYFFQFKFLKHLQLRIVNKSYCKVKNDNGEEAWLGPMQLSAVEVFTTIVNGYKLHCVKSVSHRIYHNPYLTVFSPNTGKYGPEKTPYLDIFHAVLLIVGEKLFILDICRSTGNASGVNTWGYAQCWKNHPNTAWKVPE